MKKAAEIESMGAGMDRADLSVMDMSKCETITTPVSGQKDIGNRSFSVVSMFSGCGGMDLGFTGGFTIFGKKYHKQPFDIVWANDFNEAAVRTYRRNIADNIIGGDVWQLMETMPKTADVVIGGFPCQDISVNGKRKGVEGKRSGLYKAMVEAIGNLRPKIFVAENVKGLLMGDQSSLKQVLRDFRALGYSVTYDLYNAADYGVPQTRDRVFIVGTLDSARQFVKPAPILAKNQWMTAEEAIYDLEEMQENGLSNHIWSRANTSAEQGNRRLKADRPAYTIRAECHGNIQFHYKLPRRISMREAARFQTFPDNFVFDAMLRETERQVGNAVPPVLAWHMAGAVARYLNENL